MKARISKKSLNALPKAVAEQIESLGKDYRISSFTYEQKPEGFAYIAGEGERITVVRGENSARVEMVSEMSVGAGAVSYAIGERITAPVGSFIIIISYYTRYFMSVINIGLPALKA